MNPKYKSGQSQNPGGVFFRQKKPPRVVLGHDMLPEILRDVLLHAKYQWVVHGHDMLDKSILLVMFTTGDFPVPYLLCLGLGIFNS